MEKFRDLFDSSAYNNCSSVLGKRKKCSKAQDLENSNPVFTEAEQKIFDNVLCQLDEARAKQNINEPDWEERRFECAMNFMGNMLNADTSFKAKMVTDMLYKDLAQFSVMCADALINELKKQ